MKILVAWASRNGATREIAERIAERLQAAGHTADLRSVTTTPDIAGYDAFVIGSSVYMGAWQKEAMTFVRQRRAILAARPTWLFSSGPLMDPGDRGLREEAERKEIGMLRPAAELEAAVHPREHRAFFGVLRPDRLSFAHKVIRATPAGRRIMPAGDFRDWTAIEGWADGIARDLASAPAAVGTSPGG